MDRRTPHDGKDRDVQSVARIKNGGVMVDENENDELISAKSDKITED